MPELSYLMVDGKGDPNTVQEYKEAVEALYSVSYTIKFTVKRDGGSDYTVMPLEGLWWVDDMSTFTEQEKSAWIWTMMILQPDEVSVEQVEQAATQAASKKPLPGKSRIRLERLREGAAAQILHMGPSAPRSQRSIGSTTSLPRMVTNEPASTTRSISAIRAGARRRS